MNIKAPLLMLISISLLFTYQAYSTEPEESLDNLWLKDVEQAIELSKETKKPILVNFTGSAWCIFCKLQKQNIYSDVMFINYAKNNLILLEVDFPRRNPLPENIQEQNVAFAKKFNVRGLPSTLLLDDSQQILWKHGGYFSKGPEVFIETLEEQTSN